jgi:hypothetical protein
MDDVYPVDWGSVDSLRSASEFYRAKAAAMTEQMRPYERFAPPPPKPSFSDLVPPDTPAIDWEEVEQRRRTAAARMQIEQALAEEERLAEQQRQQAQSAFRNSGIGQLLTR